MWCNARLRESAARYTSASGPRAWSGRGRCPSSAIPLDRAGDAVLERHGRLVAEERPRLPDVRLRVANVALPGLAVRWLDCAADNVAHGVEQLIEGNASPGRDVDHFAAGL